MFGPILGGQQNFLISESRRGGLSATNVSLRWLIIADLTLLLRKRETLQRKERPDHVLTDPLVP